MTGIDLSRRSIEHARASARCKGADIRYLHGSYLVDPLMGPYDAAFCIYGDVGALSPAARDLLLGRTRDSLKPGGSLAFDVTTARHVEDNPRPRSWNVETNGFWRPTPHLVLEEGFDYPGNRVYLHQYAVLEDTGELSVYRIWEQYYDPESLGAVLEARGYLNVEFFGDLAGRPYEPDSQWIGIVARVS